MTDVPLIKQIVDKLDSDSSPVGSVAIEKVKPQELKFFLSIKTKAMASLYGKGSKLYKNLVPSSVSSVSKLCVRTLGKSTNGIEPNPYSAFLLDLTKESANRIKKKIARFENERKNALDVIYGKGRMTLNNDFTKINKKDLRIKRKFVITAYPAMTVLELTQAIDDFIYVNAMLQSTVADWTLGKHSNQLLDEFHTLLQFIIVADRLMLDVTVDDVKNETDDVKKLKENFGELKPRHLKVDSIKAAALSMAVK